MTDTKFASLLNNKQALEIIALYRDAGFETRFVGGCVRDCLMGVDMGDIDMATTATPQQGQELLATAGVKTIPTGIDHGTITAVRGGQNFEITTLRHDVKTDGRRATVAYTNDWLDDAKRRDFTVNAMSVDIQGQLFDPFNGQADLAKGIVRFIGDATRRIQEDALRILRFFRFNATMGKGGMDAEGLSACIAQAPLLQNLSKERIAVEVFKLLNGVHCAQVWDVINAHMINKYFLEKSNNINCLKKISNLKNKDKPFLLALFKTADRDAEFLQNALKLSNKKTRFFKDTLQAYRAHEDGQMINALLYYYGANAVIAAMILCYGDDVISEAALHKVVVHAQQWQKPQCPVSGDDLIKRGIEPGKELGEVLKKIERYWIDNDFKPTKQMCLERL